MSRQLTYFPSLSTGLKSYLSNNRELTKGICSRFYSKEFPSGWRYPKFLTTAGHNYGDMGHAKKMGLDDSDVMVIGDSGGFQILTGTIELTPELPKKIFDWLDENCDIAINLDIPPRGKIPFDECLDTSVRHFGLFESWQTGKTDFLNVLQGDTLDEYIHWFNSVKHFEFSGWAIGGAQNFNKMFAAIAVLIQNGEFENKNKRWYHFLGVSKVPDFFVLSFLQKWVNEYYGDHIQISTDTSSPGQYAVYGSLITDIDLVNMNYTTFSRLPRREQIQTWHDADFPNIINFPYSITVDDLRSYNTQTIAKMTIFNTYMVLYGLERISEIVQLPYQFLTSLVGQKFQTVIESLKAMLDDPKNAIKIYQSYSHFYSKYGATFERSIDDTSVTDEFFEF